MTHQLFLGGPDEVARAAVGALIRLEGEEGRHAGTVVRLRPGERYFVADGLGRRLLAEAEMVDKSTVVGRVLEVAEEAPPEPRLVLVQALAKGDRDDQAIEAATELGVDEIVAWQAERSVVVWRADRAAKSLAKWTAVVSRATKQSRRSRMPLVSGPMDTRALVGLVREAAAAFVLHEEANDPLAGAELPEHGDVLVLVGPEGGITEREIALLSAAGARPVRLGSTILRASSAGPAALAVLNAKSRWS